ncbi:MAG: enoyl-CoA hydratase/isomerase family protein, partial [Actinobacteria bacterium]|nr:enoyl-CoA hydratase/isomerase family protein [Actinomycetota bacterium]
MSSQLNVQDNNAVRLISWTRPEALNAMSIDMWHGTRDALDS